MDKSEFMYFVNSFRWHCAILMKTTRPIEDGHRAVRGVCDFRPECIKMRVEFEILLLQMSEKIGGFNTLTVLIVRFDERVMVNLD